jgi:hypothetical protein
MVNGMHRMDRTAITSFAQRLQQLSIVVLARLPALLQIGNIWVENAVLVRLARNTALIIARTPPRRGDLMSTAPVKTP